MDHDNSSLLIGSFFLIITPGLGMNSLSILEERKIHLYFGLRLAPRAETVGTGIAESFVFDSLLEQSEVNAVYTVGQKSAPTRDVGALT